MAGIASVVGLVASGVSAIGTIAAGRQAARAQVEQGLNDQAALNFEADQLDVQAKEERASAQRDAMELARRKKLALSSLQSRAAGSGFSASDATALKLAGDIAKYGTLQEQTALYGGESRAAGLRGQAEGKRISGAAAARGGRLAARGTIIGSISTMADKFASMADRYAPKPSSGASYYYG